MGWAGTAVALWHWRGWGRVGWVGRLKEPVSSSLSLGAEEARAGTPRNRAPSLAVCYVPPSLQACRTLGMAVSHDHSDGPVLGPDQESQQPKPWPGPGPGLAWLPLQCQAFPSEPRSWAEMAGGPGLLPGSLPASQAPGQGWIARCNHSGPGGRRGGGGDRPDRPSWTSDRRYAALLWPEYPAGQGSVPRPPGASLDSSPIPGGPGEAGHRHFPPSRCTCLAPSRPFLRRVRYLCPPHSARPSACTETAGVGTSAGQDSSSWSKRGSTPVLSLRDASLPCPRKGRV